MRFLILGSGGFIGSHLTERLLQNPSLQVVGLDLFDYKIGNHLTNRNFTFIKSDVYKYEGLEEEIKNCDVVIFLATICNPSLYNTEAIETIHSNFSRPAKIVDLCSKHKRWLIVSSTCEVYGKTISSQVNDPYTNLEWYEQNEDRTQLVLGPIDKQRWCYACAKQLLDRYIYAHHKEHGLPFTAIRPYNFFGPRMDFIPGKDGSGLPRVLACFMKALIDREPLYLVDGGNQYRVITYIDDAIDALMRILDRFDSSNGEVFNIANPQNETTIKDLAIMMRDIYANLSNDKSYLDLPILPVTSKQFYGEGYEDCDRRVPNIDKAKKLLSWHPKTNLKDTVARTVEFFYKYYV